MWWLCTLPRCAPRSDGGLADRCSRSITCNIVCICVSVPFAENWGYFFCAWDHRSILEVSRHCAAQRSSAQPQRLHWRRRFLHCGNEGKAPGLDVTADLPYAAQVAVRQSSRPFVGGASAHATSAQATVLTMQASLSYVMLGNLVVVSLLCR